MTEQVQKRTVAIEFAPMSASQELEHFKESAIWKDMSRYIDECLLWHHNQMEIELNESMMRNHQGACMELRALSMLPDILINCIESNCPEPEDEE